MWIIFPPSPLQVVQCSIVSVLTHCVLLDTQCGKNPSGDVPSPVSDEPQLCFSALHGWPCLLSVPDADRGCLLSSSMSELRGSNSLQWAVACM